MSGETSLLEGKPGFAMDFNFFVEDRTVVIDEADAREQQGCVPLSSTPVVCSHAWELAFAFEAYPPA